MAGGRRQASLLRDKPHMVAIADAPGLGMGENALIDGAWREGLGFGCGGLVSVVAGCDAAPFSVATTEDGSVTVPSATGFGSGTATTKLSLARNTASFRRAVRVNTRDLRGGWNAEVNLVSGAVRLNNRPSRLNNRSTVT